MQASDVSETRARAALADLSALAALDRARLRQLWRALYAREAPRKASRTLLRYGVAWRLQEQAYGGLSATTRRQLDKLAQQLQAASAAPQGLVPGTRLIRQWRGQRHEVTVLKTAYAYRGERYASLSAIARLISGSHCSGPRFFGLEPGSTRPPRAR